MPIEFEYIGGKGITVPYRPIFDTIRKNRGFVDTRNRPDLAGLIAEGTESAALGNLLIDIASRRRYFSLGCDLGEHQESEAPASRRFVAGGYIHVSAFRYELQGTSAYDAFCESLEAALDRTSRKELNWRIQCQGGWVAFKLPNEEEITKPSMWIWFFAADRTSARAIKSREDLIKLLTVLLNKESLYKNFKSNPPDET